MTNQPKKARSFQPISGIGKKNTNRKIILSDGDISFICGATQLLKLLPVYIWQVVISESSLLGTG
jgi:hypothetical protein